MIRRANNRQHAPTQLTWPDSDLAEAIDLLWERTAGYLEYVWVGGYHEDCLPGGAWAIAPDGDEVREVVSLLRGFGSRTPDIGRYVTVLEGLATWRDGVVPSAHQWPALDRIDEAITVLQSVTPAMLCRRDMLVEWVNRPDAIQPPVRTPIAPDLRADVWDKTHGLCWYCGVRMHPFRNYHVDHVVPVIDGGTNDLGNLVPSCQPCNGRKGSRPAEYLRRFFADGLFWSEREGLS